jgi:hypothetical protein
MWSVINWQRVRCAPIVRVLHSKTRSSVLYIDDEACGILQLYHTVRLLGIKTEYESNLRFKITRQNEVFQIRALQVVIAIGDGWLTCISVGLRRVHGNLQKCIPADGDIVPRSTLLNWRINVADLPCWMMKSLAGKDDPIKSVATRRLGLLNKDDVGCCMTLVAWIQSACKGSAYRISVVIPKTAQCRWLEPLRRTTSERKENSGAN